jgi:hypothetical protein
LRWEEHPELQLLGSYLVGTACAASMNISSVARFAFVA